LLCADIKRFLDQNPNEIISIFYEDYTEVRGVLRGNCRRPHEWLTDASWFRFPGSVDQ
jgi:hypothetical protein